jgi:hypothetical protein
VTNYKPLLGLLVLAVPVLVIWFLMRKSKMPRAEDNNHEKWMYPDRHSGHDGD